MKRREWWSEVVQDARLAVRQLRRRPAFALVAGLTLAIGIGANTAIFSAADHVLWRPLPYVDADRVVRVFETDRRTGGGRKEAASANFLDWRERSRSAAMSSACVWRSARSAVTSPAYCYVAASYSLASGQPRAWRSPSA